MKLAISLFEDETAAEKAVDELYSIGFHPDDVEIFTHERITSEPESQLILAAAAPGASSNGSAGFSTPYTAGIVAAEPTAQIVHPTVRTFLETKGVHGNDLEFFDRGLRGNGALVVITARHHEDLKRAEKALSDLGGKTEEERV